MASISTSANGTRSIQFTGRDRKRRTIRLGKATMKVAQEVKVRVERLLSAQIAGVSVDQETAAWLGQVGDELHAKLAAVGLVSARASATLAAFLDDYIASRTDAKPQTIANLRKARNHVVAFFGAEKSLDAVTRGDADRWAIWLRNRCAQATAGRTIGSAKQFFTMARRDRLVSENPFEHLRGGQQTNPKRKRYVSRDEIGRVLDACPNAEWRLIVALCRYGGLRCPSEILGLQITDVNWERNRFLVRSPKTEHHEGKDERLVPIFPELKPYLEQAFEQAKERQTHFIARSGGDGTNLRTRFGKIVRRAGLVPWPKLFHNLRASCETDLVAIYPLHCVTSWLGNSAAIATAHYLIVTEADFDRAATEGGAKSGAQAVQNPVQHGATPSSTEKHGKA